MTEDPTATEAQSEGVGAWETIAMVIMLAVMAMAIGSFAFGLARYGISH